MTEGDGESNVWSVGNVKAELDVQVTMHRDKVL